MICLAYNTLPRCPKNHYSKNRMNRIILSYKELQAKSTCVEGYSVATLSKSCFNVVIIILSLKSIGHFYNALIDNKRYYLIADVKAKPAYKKATLLKM